MTAEQLMQLTILQSCHDRRTSDGAQYSAELSCCRTADAAQYYAELPCCRTADAAQ